MDFPVDFKVSLCQVLLALFCIPVIPQINFASRGNYWNTKEPAANNCHKLMNQTEFFFIIKFFQNLPGNLLPQFTNIIELTNFFSKKVLTH